MIIAVIEDQFVSRENLKWRGRQQGSMRNLNRRACSWYIDYLSPDPIHTAVPFRRRFRVPLSLYRRFETELSQIEPQMYQLRDATGKKGAKNGKNIL